MHSSDAFIPQYGELVTTAFSFHQTAKRFRRWSQKRNVMSMGSLGSNFTRATLSSPAGKAQKVFTILRLQRWKAMPRRTTKATPTGFIRLHALRLKVRAALKSKKS